MMLAKYIYKYRERMPSKFTATISYLDSDRCEHLRFENTTVKCLQKIWCGTIQGCGTTKIISR